MSADTKDMYARVPEVYRSTDPIHGMRVEVSVQRVFDRRNPNPENRQTPLDIGTRELRWGEKLIGPSTVQKLMNPLYAEQRHGAANTELTQLERDYIKVIEDKTRDTGSEFKGETIFSYVDSDGHVGAKEWGLGITTSAEIQTPLARNVLGPMDQSNQMRIVAQGRSKTAKRSQKHASIGDFTTFEICVAVGGDDPDMKKATGGLNTHYEETLLFVKAFDDGAIQMRPTEGKWRFKDPLGSIYEYTIDIVSERKTHRKAEAAARLQAQHKAALKANMIGEKFEAPPPSLSDRRFCINGQICRATNFVRGPIFVDYFLDLPSEWRVPDDCGILTATTETTSCGPDGAYNFCHPLEWELVLQKAPSTPEPVRMIIAVGSLNIFGRHRAEGYGYIDLPMVPGHHKLRVPTWRAVGPVRDQMRDFFVGGSTELDDPYYVAYDRKKMKAAGKHVLSRYGFVTESSGVLEIELNVAVQARAVQEAARQWMQMAGENFLLAASVNARKAEKMRAREEEDEDSNVVDGAGGASNPPLEASELLASVSDRAKARRAARKKN